MNEYDDHAFLEYTVKSLVDHPEKVTISRTVDEMGVLLTLDVHPEDMGKIIGRSGNTAKAIRTLLRVVGMKHNARVNLKINEPEGGLRSQSGSEGRGSDEEGTSSTPPASSAASQSIDDAMDDLRL